MDKAPDAYRTISEVADDLDIAQHVLRFWETKFPQIKPLKRGGGRRYYRPDDVELVTGIRHLLYKEGYTIKGVQRILKEQGPRAVMALAEPPPALQSPPAPQQPPAAELASFPKAAPSIPDLPPVPSAPVRPVVAQFYEPDPAPYRQEPVFQPEPVAPLTPPQQRDMLFDLPEIRKASAAGRSSEFRSAVETETTGTQDFKRDPIPASISQVSMVRGGLTQTSLTPALQPHVNAPSAFVAQSQPVQAEVPAQPAFSMLAEQDEHSSLADALRELEAIRTGLATLLEQRPRSFS